VSGRQQSNQRYNKGQTNDAKCSHCGRDPNHPKCPALGQTCHGCGRLNHFESVCRSSKKMDSRNNAHHKTQMVDRCESEGTAPFTEYSFAIDTSYSIDTPTTKLPHICLDIMKSKLDFIIDTGSTLNIIDSHSYEKLCSKEHIHLEPPLTNVYAYNAKEPLNIIGRFTANIINHNEEASAEFYVLSQVSQCILGYDTASKLNIVHISQNLPKKGPK
jgi:hypothetical protein